MIIFIADTVMMTLSSSKRDTHRAVTVTMLSYFLYFHFNKIMKLLHPGGTSIFSCFPSL